jgi:hypothetical protein
MTVSEFRKAVKQRWPHVKISIRTVSFQDLARDSAKFVTVEGDLPGEFPAIKTLAKEAGLLCTG